MLADNLVHRPHLVKSKGYYRLAPPNGWRTAARRPNNNAGRHPSPQFTQAVPARASRRVLPLLTLS